MSDNRNPGGGTPGQNQDAPAPAQAAGEGLNEQHLGAAEEQTFGEPHGGTQAGQDPSLPNFLLHPGKIDKILLTLLGVMTVFSLVMIPLRPNLMVNAPWLLALLTGSGIGTLITAAQNQQNVLLWSGLALLAALSHIKFLIVYYFMGKHWGQEFISWIFASHTPLWYRKLEGFVERHLLFCLALGFVPFSPIPATILVAIAGIRKVKAWMIGVYIYLLALANKCFYLYLGLTFGEGIQPTLQTIDKYMMQITLALVAYVFILNWYKSSKKQQSSK
ncbi:hypothetical protein [Rothia nasimurium]|uniref:hypothetical protein n=1 Tax=Rothia nasimurium TaxID=85336 RepID=UPI003B9F1895